ncbi:MAG: hypothetical protein SOZ43_04505 [Eubacteriales bacterium]|nr:hypothetical protein [Eubacteriales bacterium]
MKNKRFLAVLCLLLCVVLAFTFVGCNKDDGKDNGKDNGVKPTDKVTVTFKNGDTVVDTIEINKGTAVAATTKTVTAPEGKQFKSWQKDGVDYDFTAKVNENITLVATFEDVPAPAPSTFTITFKDADGKVLKTLQVEKKNYINPDDVPTAPDKTKDHMTFVRWGLESDTMIGIDYNMDVVGDVTYVAVYEVTKHTVTIKDADTGAVLDTQTIPYGGKVTPYEAEVGKEIVSVKLGDADFNYDTYTVEGNIEILVKLAVATRTVTFKDTENNPIGTAQTVAKGGNAVLPTAPEGFYWVVNMSELVNITENKEIVLGKIPTSAYKDFVNGTHQMTVTKSELPKTAEKYHVELGHGGNATKDPALQSYGLLMFQEGQYFQFKANIAGTLLLKGNTDKKGQHMTLEVYVDGYLYTTASIDTPNAVNITLADLPAGEHTIRLVMSKATVDEGGDGFATWSGLAFSTVTMQEVKPQTCHVTFKNADGSVISSTTVKYGEAVAKPATDPTPAEGYLFSFWSADGKTAYDFSKALEDDLELIAVYERDVPSYTITFKDAEGGTVGTASVKEGANAELPAVPSGKLWTLATAEYAKLFNVTEAREVTLGTTDASKYSVTAGIYLNSEDSTNKLKTNYGADFTTGNWVLQAADGRYVALPQAEGAYFTATGDFSEFRFTAYLNAGLKCTYAFYVDDVLVKSLTYDNSKGEKGLSSGWVTVLNKANMGAGQHTIKVVIAEGSGAVTAVRFGEVKK